MRRTWLVNLAVFVLLLIAIPRFVVSGLIPAVHQLRGDFAAAFPTAYFARWRPDFPTSQVLGSEGALWNYGPMFHFLTLPLLLVPQWDQVPSAWAIANLGALTISFLLVWRLRGPSAAGSPAAIVATAGLWLLFQPLVNCFAQGNIEIVEVALVLLALVCLQRGREGAAGGMMAVASCLKLLPVGFLGWMILRRRWRAVAAGAAVMVLVAALTATTLGWGRSLTRRSSLSIIGDAPVAGFHELSITSVFMHRASRLDLSTPTPRWFPLDRRTAAARAGAISSVLLAACYAGLLLHASRLRPREVMPEEIAILFLLMLILPPWNHDYYYLFALVPLTLLLVESAGDRDLVTFALAIVGYLLMSPPIPFGIMTRTGLFSGSFAYALNFYDVPVAGSLVLLFAATRRLLVLM